MSPRQVEGSRRSRLASRGETVGRGIKKIFEVSLHTVEKEAKHKKIIFSLIGTHLGLGRSLGAEKRRATERSLRRRKGQSGRGKKEGGDGELHGGYGIQVDSTEEYEMIRRDGGTRENN
jgi:hypothetical protein